jgi:hypothetical protein
MDTNSILLACNVIVVIQSLLLMRMTQRWLILGRVLDEADTKANDVLSGGDVNKG